MLIVVVGVLAVLSLIAATFGMLMSVELAASRNQTEYEMARQAAHAGAAQLLADLAASLPAGGITIGPTQGNFCPIDNAADLGCRQLYSRDGVKAYYILHNHPPVVDDSKPERPSLPWKAGLGNEDSGMFNINAMGFASDLGSNSDPSIRYTSFETSMVRLLKSRFDAMSLADQQQVDTIRDPARFPSFWQDTDPDPSIDTASNERQRIAILLAKAIITWRHGTDKLPGTAYAEEKRLGHLPRWSATLGCTETDGREGVGYPTDSNNNYEWGWVDPTPPAPTDALSSIVIKRTADPANPWCYTEPKIWLTNTGGAWNDDIGVSPSGVTWGVVESVSAGPPYVVSMKTTFPGWNNWSANRWYDSTGTNPPYYLYIVPIASAPIIAPNVGHWYLIGDGDLNGVASDTNWVEIVGTAQYPLPTIDPVDGDRFCIIQGPPKLGGDLVNRWDNATPGASGDLVPTAFTWPDGTLTTENGVFDRVRVIGIVGAADNTPTPPFLEDIAPPRNWADDCWIDYYVVHILDGAGAGQVRRIADNGNSRLELESDWTVLPSVGSHYVIEYADNDLPSKYRPDLLQGDDRQYLSLGDLRDSIIVPALQVDDDNTGADLGTGEAQSMADLIMPYFLPYLTVSSRSLKASQWLGGINDWEVDGLDNDADGVADDEDEPQQPKIVAKALYEKLGLKAWAYGLPDPPTGIKQAAQLVANIIDYRDSNHFPLKLTSADLGEDPTTLPFEVYGAEGLHVTEVMASPDDIVSTTGTEMTSDGVVEVPGPEVDVPNEAWDWNAALGSFDSMDANGNAAEFVWPLPPGARGYFAIRIIGSQHAFEFTYRDPDGFDHTCTATPSYPDPENQAPGTTWYYAFLREGGKLLAVTPDVAGNLGFKLVTHSAGPQFRGFALLPQYIEITNIAANDMLVNGLTVNTDAGSISLSGMTNPWLQLIRGASADGTFPINYGTYVIAISEAAYERQWSHAASPNGIWGDAATEEYPVYFAGDRNTLTELDNTAADARAKALMMGAYDGVTRDWAVSIVDPAGLLIAGGAVDASQGVIASSQYAYSSVEKNTILQPTWDVPTPPLPTPYWTSHCDPAPPAAPAPPTQLVGSQNTVVTAEADPPRTAVGVNAQFTSNLNKQYAHIWKSGSVDNYPTLAQGSYLADFSRSQVYPIIRNQLYPTVGWLGLVPTSNDPWRTVDAIGGGLVQSATNTPATLQTYRTWTAGAPDDPTNRRIKIYAGAGIGQIRTIVAINASDPMTFDMDQDWTATDIPDNTSRYVFLDPNRPEELLGTLIAKAATGGVYARFNINTAPTDTLKAVFEDGQAALISNARTSLNDKSWATWDELLNDPIFKFASNDYANPTGLGFFDDAAALGVANEDSGAGLIADDYMDDADEKEEWARRFANLFDLRSTAFRFIVSGLVFTETAGLTTPPVATARIEMDVDLSDAEEGPRIVHFRYLSQ